MCFFSFMFLEIVKFIKWILLGNQNSFQLNENLLSALTLYREY